MNQNEILALRIFVISIVQFIASILLNNAQCRNKKFELVLQVLSYPAIVTSVAEMIVVVMILASTATCAVNN